MKKIIKLIICTLIIFHLLPNIISAQCNLTDWTALKALYESTDGDNWIDNTGWQEVTGNAPTGNCNLQNLFGVILDAQGRVSDLSFYSNGLSGSIPPQLGNLSNLLSLILFSNDLSGSIPPELGNLSNLTYLYLRFNLLNGNIPPELGNLSNLTYLYLRFNQLNGSIPPELGNLSNLQELWLGLNQLSGSIPAELGNLSNLTVMELGGNQLSGNIPPELGNLSNLTSLSLNNNELDGSIPSELGNLSNLEELSIGFNELTGAIPPELGNLFNLSVLRLYNNRLTGIIPFQLGNLSNLTLLQVNNNDLSGCYNENLAILCTQLNHPEFDGDADISDGNNLETNWDDFCNNNSAVCETYVYPGDLNNDGIVNNIDVSLSGLFWYQEGIERASELQDIEWYAHSSDDWGIVNNQNKDIKHHDCNGDGVINETDTVAVRTNMGLTWRVPDPTPPAPPESDYLVMLNPIDQIFDGYLVINVALERRAGGDLTILSGHFTIDYSDVEGDFGFVDLDFFPITWLGVPTQNLWFDTMHFPEEKKFEVGFTRNDNSDSTGSGDIAQLILEYSSLASRMGLADVSYQFKVNTIGVHNNSGEYTPIEDQLLQVNLNSVCKPNWTIDEDTPFQNKYQSSNDITTNGFVIIGEDQEVEYEANRVTLNSGFSIKVGENSQFRAGYGNCN